MRGLLLALPMLMAALPCAAGASAWAVDPLAAQADLPAVGASAFDRVFSRGGRHRVPFPFAALLRELRAHAGVDALGRPGLKQVLVPMGRSLQRMAGAPQFFRYPRAVVAVDGQPAAPAPGDVLLKDRLYIGYHEKAAVLEVISYNEAAGRFEFQVVQDYRAGGTPRVFHARRAICVSCHQNHAPIFSRQQWDETNANPRVAAMLAATARSYQGIAVARGVDEPYAIDNATDRANQFAAWQLLWRAGCGAGEAGERCRAGALIAALQLRLSGGAFDRSGEAFRSFRAMLGANWKRLWPDGLALPSPNLPNRDPFGSDPDARRASFAVPAAFDALALRAPLEVWRHERPEDVERLVAGVGEFVRDGDLAALDRLLARAAGRAPLSETVLECTPIERKTAAAALRMTTLCTAAGTASAARVKLYAKGGSIASGAFDALRLDGALLPPLAVHAGGIAGSSARFALRSARGPARDAAGQRIERAVLDWSAQPARLTLVRRHDFALVERAVQQLLISHDSTLADGPIQGVALLDAIAREIDPAAAPACCGSGRTTPAPSLKDMPEERREGIGEAGGRRGPAVPSKDGVDLSGFYRACGVCHDTPSPFPPNFLAGDAPRVEAQFRHCAPRIRARLRAWLVDPARRDRTPMPPPLGVHLLGVTEAAWAGSEALRGLIRQVEEVLAQAPPQAAPRNGADDYEALPACMPLAHAGSAGGRPG